MYKSNFSTNNCESIEKINKKLIKTQINQNPEKKKPIDQDAHNE